MSIVDVARTGVEVTSQVALPIAFDDATELLVRDGRRLLQDATDVAATAVDGVPAGRRLVELQLGEVTPVALLRATVPLRWEARARDRGLPTLEGTLEVTTPGAAGPVTVRVVGRYVVGHDLPPQVLHRAAQRTVDRFVGEVAAQLRRRVRTEPLTSAAGRPPVRHLGSLRNEVVFDGEGPCRRELDVDATHLVEVVGMEPWQEMVFGADGRVVVVTVLDGHGEALLDGRRRTLLTTATVVADDGAQVTIGSRGQRLTLQVVTTVAPPEPPTGQPPM